MKTSLCLIGEGRLLRAFSFRGRRRLHRHGARHRLCALGSNVVVLEALATFLPASMPISSARSARGAEGFQRNSPEHQSIQDGHRRQADQSHHGNRQTAARRTLRPRAASPSGACRIAPISAWKTPRSPEDEKGFIQCNAQQQTEDPNIYAIGDVNGGGSRTPRHEKAGSPSKRCSANEHFKLVIPAVVFTDPEVPGAVSPKPSQRKTSRLKIAKFLWGVSGRALT